jgi:hypothetical protein
MTKKLSLKNDVNGVPLKKIISKKLRPHPNSFPRLDFALLPPESGKSPRAKTSRFDATILTWHYSLSVNATSFFQMEKESMLFTAF